jgi:hypothetical protein
MSDNNSDKFPQNTIPGFSEKSLYFPNATEFGGAVTVSNNLTVTGNFTFGDAATDSLSVTGKLSQGASGSALSYTAGTPLRTLYATNAGTSGSTSAEPLLVESTLTGAGQVGGRSHFKLTANAAQGGWVNALKASTTFGASGSATGLGSCMATDLTLSAGTSSGSYACYEGNIILGSGASTGTKTSFLQFNFAGDDHDTGDSNAYLIGFGANADAGSGKFIDTDISSHTAYAGLRVFIEGVGTKYIALVSD